jgi:hypothetical protein
MTGDEIDQVGRSVAAGWIGGTPSRNAPSVSATSDTPPEGPSQTPVPTSQTDANRSQPRSAARCPESENLSRERRAAEKWSGGRCGA